jgi:4-amino-4-deoxy-L-arabinose transferase-like glycosyltransferase
MVVLLALVCFVGLNRFALIDLVDEGIYASIARQMLDSGDWITPRYGVTVFFYKPPLTYWLQAFFIHFLGATPLAARLPSALAAFLTGISIYAWARHRGALRVGRIAAIIYVCCPLVAYGLARIAMVDSLVTLFFTLAIIGWIEGYSGKRKGYLLMAIGMGLATMAKGLIGFLLPGGAFVLWILWRRDFGELRKVPWIGVSASFLLLVLPWHLAAWRAHGNWFLSEYIGRQHFQRFLGGDFAHQNPFWYYLPVLLLSTFPWFGLIPTAWWRGLQARRSERRSLECAMAMWALWAGVVFVFFSFSISKLPNYILPALPALSILIAWRLDSIWNNKRRLSLFESVSLWLPGLIIGALIFVVGVSAYQWRSQPEAPSQLARSLGRLFNWHAESQSAELLWRKLEVLTDLAPYWIALGALLLLGSLLIIICWRNAARTFAASLILSLTLIFFVTQIGFPRWSTQSAAPLNELGLRTLPAVQRGGPLVMYAIHPKHPSLRYLIGNSDRVVETFAPETLISVLQEAGSGYILTPSETTLPILNGNLKQEAAAGRWVLWRYEKEDR